VRRNRKPNGVSSPLVAKVVDACFEKCPGDKLNGSCCLRLLSSRFRRHRWSDSAYSQDAIFETPAILVTLTDRTQRLVTAFGEEGSSSIMRHNDT
jgi:hypothetical protein